MKPLDVLSIPLQGVQWLEASAGTGKTWNICMLVLRALLERGLSIDQILVVTFTKAAAAELRERIRTRLHEAWRLAEADGAPHDAALSPLLDQAGRVRGEPLPALAKRLRAALDRFDEAAVSTIHSFAQRVLADSPLASGQGLALQLVDSDAALRDELLAEAWRREVVAAPLPAELLERIAAQGTGPAAWRKALDRMLARPLAPVHWPQPATLSPAAMAANPDPHAGHARLQARWPVWRGEVEALLGDKPRFNQGSLGQKQTAASLAAWDALLADTWRNTTPSAEASRLALHRLPLRKGMSAPEHPFFREAQDWIEVQAAWAAAIEAQHSALLRRALEPLPGLLRQRLAAQRLHSFDSLLMALHEALQAPGGTDAPPLARALRARYPVALVDEFQDTDSLQWALFERLFRGPDSLLALVGDPKQSIYAFRGAELATYIAARDEVPSQDRHQLLENQRSVGPMLAALNRLFGASARPFLQPGLSHPPVRLGQRPRAALVELDTEGRALPRAALQLWPLPAEDTGRPPTRRQARASAAEATAGEILRLSTGARDGRVRFGERALEAGDLAVLVRSHGQARAVASALARRGIDAALRSRESVFASPEAEDLEHLLAALLNPGDTTRLRRALATTAMGEPASAIAALAEDDAALGTWQARFVAWRQVWLRQGPAVLVQRWLADAGVVRRLLPLRDGERRLTNLRHLAELLQQAAHGDAAVGSGAATLAGTPQAQWRWLLARRQDPALDETHVLRLASDRHLVQVLTIHQSKGLEYPVVFLPFLWDPGPGLGRPEPPVERRDGGGGLRLDFDPASATDPARVAEAQLEALAESQRLNYVALTRASARCHLVVGAFRRQDTDQATAGSCQRLPLNWLVQPFAAGAAGTAADIDDAVRAWFGPDKSVKRWDAAQLNAAWAQLAAGAEPGAIALDTRPFTAAAESPDERLARQEPPAARLVLGAAPPRPRARSWHLTSYSALALGAEAATAGGEALEPAEPSLAPDHDLMAAGPRLDEPPAAPDVRVDILDFPRGAAAGSCLHRAFELARFDDAPQWPEAVAQALAELPLPADPPDSHETTDPAVPGAQAQRLLVMLRDVLNTPIALPPAPAAPPPAPLRLASLGDARRRVELEFHLPLARLHAESLQRLLESHGLPGPQWRFPTLERGALRGFIDAVVEHEGRFWIIDWKSNHLGSRPADYGTAAVAAAMAEHGYHLQAQLYLLALDRLLRWRHPGYRPELHLGGALYLFVRGVRPHWPAGCGVHLSRPDVALLATLGRWLAPASPPERSRGPQ